MISQMPGVHDLEQVDGQVSLEVDGDRTDELVRALAPLGVRSLVAHPPTLEQLLLRHYGDDPSASDDETGSELGAEAEEARS